MADERGCFWGLCQSNYVLSTQSSQVVISSEHVCKLNLKLAYFRSPQQCIL